MTLIGVRPRFFRGIAVVVAVKLILTIAVSQAQSSPVSAQAASSGLPESIKKIVESRLVAYSAAFAKRFHLEVRPEAEPLAAGLEAVEIGFEVGPESGWVRCHVSLYVSAKMDIDTALGPDASRRVLEPDRHFFLRPRPGGTDPRQLISRADAANLLDRQARYFRRVAFVTADFNAEKRTGVQGVDALEEQVLNFFENMHYVRTRGCVSSTMIQHGVGVQVWLPRPGAPQYSKRMGPLAEEHFIRLPLPGAFLQEALPSLRTMEQYMHTVVERYIKNRRK